MLLKSRVFSYNIQENGIRSGKKENRNEGKKEEKKENKTHPTSINSPATCPVVIFAIGLDRRRRMMVVVIS